MKECVFRHSYSKNGTQQNQFVSPSATHYNVALIIIIIIIIIIIKIISGSYYTFRVRLNAFTKISKIK